MNGKINRYVALLIFAMLVMGYQRMTKSLGGSMTLKLEPNTKLEEMNYEKAVYCSVKRNQNDFTCIISDADWSLYIRNM